MYFLANCSVVVWHYMRLEYVKIVSVEVDRKRIDSFGEQAKKVYAFEQLIQIHVRNLYPTKFSTKWKKQLVDGN